jgi:ketosteroid isomerase-like protein
VKFHLSFSSMIAALFISFVAVTAAQAESHSARTLSNSEALNTAERWATVVAQGDIAGLTELLHTDYLHVHTTALVESKAKFIEALQTGARKYEPIRFEDLNVRVFGSAAVVSGKFVLRATARDKVVEGVNRFMLWVVTTPNGLQVATYQATSIPQAK